MRTPFSNLAGFSVFCIFASVKPGYTYIMSNKNRTTFYIGVTSDLRKRVTSHQSGMGGVFTGRYNCVHLVHFEEFGDIRDAIAREKQLKTWRRQWKIDLIRSVNPEMKDLSGGI